MNVLKINLLILALFFVQNTFAQPKDITNLIKNEYTDSGITEYVHTVRKGENLSKIAKKYKMSLEELVALGNIGDDLKIGGNVVIWRSYAPKKKSVNICEGFELERVILNQDTILHYYTVKDGDNLYGIAKCSGTQVTSLMQLNETISSKKGYAIYPNQRLVIQREVRNIPVAPATNIQYKIEKKRHVVADGETIYSIAQKYNTTPSKMQRYNKKLDTIKVGQTIVVPARIPIPEVTPNAAGNKPLVKPSTTK
ncbi:MAG: LysM peptidoglycan-binding domain-containing protein [Saprospiraceae bacterium]|nr:LysM peptidoglycan-binding domain-containing protein [Saprospiraceae bacterium]